LGSNSESYSNVDQPSFFACEITVDGTAIKYTGRNDHFNCRIVMERVVNTQRYSFQRGYYEAYHFDTDYDNWSKEANEVKNIEPIALTETKRYLGRRAPYPIFEKTGIQSILANGSIIIEKPKEYFRDIYSWIAQEESGQGGYVTVFLPLGWKNA
jgi:hypothetical protein